MDLSAELPSGVVTFMFTDIEGSTRLVETLGKNYDPLLDAHRAHIRSSLAAHGGIEIRTEGDAFFAVFASATAAVSSALDAQRNLCAHDWPQEALIRVRIGLHTGEARLAAGDYTGVAVHRAARISAAAHGGQVIISDATRSLVADELPSSAGLRDLGEHELRGLERPERLWQLTHPDLIGDFPPPRTEVLPDAAPSRADFVGRDEEFRRLVELFEDARVGRGRMALVGGEAGIGKTRLTEEVSEYASSAGARVVSGACWEGDGAPPYWAWLQVVRALSRGGDGGLNLGQVLGLGADVDAGAEQARFLLFDAVATRLRAAAEASPLVVVIDDLHWAEPSSVDLLRFAARELRRSAVLLIATYRDDEMDPDLVRSLARDGEIVSLSGLRAEDVAALMQTTVGAKVADQMVSAVSDQTGGNPFFIREVARMIGSETAGVHFRRRSIDVPAGVREVILRRVERTSDGCREILEAAAVLGAAVDPDVVARLCGKTADEIRAALDEAAVAGLVYIDPPRFVHALTRDALLGAMSSQRRAELHGRAADALAEASEVSASEIASHAIAAGRSDAAALAVRAAEEAMTALAYAEAADHFERALTAKGPRAPLLERVPILQGLVAARNAAGHRAKAREAARELADAARTLHDPELLAEAALAPGGGSGGFEIPMLDKEQISLLEEAVAAFGDDKTSSLARVLARLSVATSFEHTIERRVEAVDRAIAIAEEVGDAEALAAALLSKCDAIAGPDHNEERLAATDRVLALRDERRVGPAIEILARRFRVVALAERMDVAALDDEIQAFARVADQLRQPTYTWYVPLFRGFRAQMKGTFEDADRASEEAAEIGERAASENAVMLSTTQRMTTASYLGTVTEHAGPVTEMLQRFGGSFGTGSFQTVKAFFAAAAALENGEMEAARVAFGTVAPAVVLSLQKDAEWLGYLAFYAEAMAVVGDPTNAQDLYDLMAPYEDQFIIDGIGAGCRGPTGFILGILAEVMGEPDRAERHYRAAIEAGERAGSPPMVARIGISLGLMLLKSGRGSAELTEAARRCSALGMHFWADLAAVALKEAGAAVEPTPAPRPTPAANVFRREGEYWTLSYGGETTRARDSKGLRDLARLIAAAGREIHASELYAGSSRGADAGELDGIEGDAGPAIDDEARAAYRQRLRELEEEIAEAEGFNDTGRLGTATAERDALLAELSSALGLGGKARKVGDPNERARKAVTQRIKDAIGRLEREHAALARHLEHSVRTGTFCSYEPEEPVDWAL